MCYLLLIMEAYNIYIQQVVFICMVLFLLTMIPGVMLERLCSIKPEIETIHQYKSEIVINTMTMMCYTLYLFISHCYFYYDDCCCIDATCVIII